jgi:gamma-glutamyltranspeptidase / glutathione hydrolase
LQTQAQALVNYLDFGLDLQSAIDAPRFRASDGNVTDFEPRISPDTIAALRAAGHAARKFDTDWTMRVGGIQAISRDPLSGALFGAADARRDGAVAIT